MPSKLTTPIAAVQPLNGHRQFSREALYVVQDPKLALLSNFKAQSDGYCAELRIEVSLRYGTEGGVDGLDQFHVSLAVGRNHQRIMAENYQESIRIDLAFDSLGDLRDWLDSRNTEEAICLILNHSNSKAGRHVRRILFELADATHNLNPVIDNDIKRRARLRLGIEEPELTGN